MVNARKDKVKNAMQLTLFFTRRTPLHLWVENGSLEREIAQYRDLQARGVRVRFLTFGGAQDFAYQKDLGPIKLLYNQWNFPISLYERLLPFLFPRDFLNTFKYRCNKNQPDEGRGFCPARGKNMGQAVDCALRVYVVRFNEREWQGNRGGACQRNGKCCISAVEANYCHYAINARKDKPKIQHTETPYPCHFQFCTNSYFQTRKQRRVNESEV
jgi:hypothetical protein